jgi:hypothetical protein
VPARVIASEACCGETVCASCYIITTNTLHALLPIVTSFQHFQSTVVGTEVLIDKNVFDSSNIDEVFPDGTQAGIEGVLEDISPHS